MKKFFLFILFIFFISFLTSCSKETTSLVGSKWKTEDASIQWYFKDAKTMEETYFVSGRSRMEEYEYEYSNGKLTIEDYFDDPYSITISGNKMEVCEYCFDGEIEDMFILYKQ